jgi:hypothetical protein
MSDNNTPKSPNCWHVIEPAVKRLAIGQRGTNNSLIAVEFDADQLLPDLGAAAAKEEIRTQLAAKLRDSPKIARFAQLRDNLAAADKGIEEAKLQRDQAELDRRSYLMTPLTPDRVEQMSGISRRWHEADGALASARSRPPTCTTSTSTTRGTTPAIVRPASSTAAASTWIASSRS